MSDNGALLLDLGRDAQGKVIEFTGKQFYRQGATGVADSIQAVGDAGLVRPATYHLINGRGLAKQDNLVWTQWHDTNAERNTVLDAEGIIGERGAIYVVEFQNGGMWIGDHQRIRSAVGDGNYVMPLQQEEVNTLLDAIKRGDAKTLKEKGWTNANNIYTFDSAEAFVEESGSDSFLRRNPAYVVLRTQEQAQGDLRGYHSIEQQKNNVSLIIPSGGKKPLGKMLDKAASFGWTQFGSHHDGYTNVNSGRVVFLDYHYDGVVTGNDLSSDGLSVGVAPEALAAREKIVEPLDQIVAEQETSRIPELHIRRALDEEAGLKDSKIDELVKVMLSYNKQ